jgi:tetratricopeptide (TPR) repeat protein
MTLIRRRLLHKRAAEALADSPRSRTDVRIAAAAAAQFRGAGDARAAEWYHLAAQLAVEVYANAEARTFLEAALALDVAGSETGSLHLGLGELAMVNGDYGLAIKELTTAAAQAEGTTLGIAEHRLGEVRRLVGQFDIAAEHFERSAAIHPRPADVFADWALLLHRQGDVEGSLAMARRALGAAEQSDDKSGRSRAHNIFGVISVDPSQAMNHIDIALDLAGDDEIAAMAALNNKAHLLHQIGNDDAAVRMVQQAIDIAARTGHRHREAALRNHLADLYHRSGRREMSEQEQTKAMAVFADIETEGWQPEVWLLSRW